MRGNRLWITQDLNYPAKYVKPSVDVTFFYRLQNELLDREPMVIPHALRHETEHGEVPAV